MAGIVIGIASSHTPQLSSGVDMWPDHADRDRRHPWLLGRDGEFRTYDEQLPLADPRVAEQLAGPVWEAKYHLCQDAIKALAGRLAKAQPDIAVVIGDDQRELFLDDGIPAFACFAGDQLVDMPPTAEALDRMPKGIRAASWAVHAEQPERHPVSAELSRHVAEQLTAAEFDITLFTQQPAGRSLGHAFTFPRYRLGLPAATPIVPVFINTYYPPNVPSAGRCFRLGQVIRSAVHSWDAHARVAIIASGGLSHFVIDEDLDRGVLSAITQQDASLLSALPRARLRSGNSEILNWVAAAGALEGLTATVIDYVPGYRSPAGTGTGMAFAYWELAPEG
jgi:3-O-methylgallate 3,4-dioxygenase